MLSAPAVKASRFGIVSYRRAVEVDANRKRRVSTSKTSSPFQPLRTQKQPSQATYPPLLNSSLIILPTISLSPPLPEAPSPLAPATRYPPSALSSNSNGVIGPGLPNGASLGLTGFAIPITFTFPKSPCAVLAMRACAIMSCWYWRSFLLTSESRRTWPGRALFLEGSSRAGVEVGAIVEGSGATSL
jgi:hypothetical protein